MPRTVTYGSEARSPSNEVTTGTTWSSADPCPGTRSQPRGDAQAGSVAVSDWSPGATTAATGRRPRSQPPAAPGRSVGTSTWTPANPAWVIATTSGGICTSTACPAFADGMAATAGVPLAAVATMRMPGRTVTGVIDERFGSSDEAARTSTPPTGGRLGAV